MFGIFKTYSDVKKGIKDPALLGQDLALDVIKGPAILVTIIAIIFFAALFILAFTQIFGGPYLGFKIIFWILFLPSLFLGAIFWMFIGQIKKMMDSARKKMKKDENVIDVTPE